MNGRIYDPKLGRMLQVDPFVQDAKDSQSLNRYTYVRNNPLSYTDPSGYFLKGLLGVFARIPALNVISTALACGLGGPVGCAVWSAALTYGATGDIFKAIRNGIIAGVTAQALQNIAGSSQ